MTSLLGASNPLSPAGACYPRDWAGRLRATPAQVATADRLIAEGVAKTIAPRDYSSRARVHLQLARIDPERRWTMAGRWFIAPDGKLVGWGYSLAEARGRGRIERAKRRAA